VSTYRPSGKKFVCDSIGVAAENLSQYNQPALAGRIEQRQIGFKSGAKSAEWKMARSGLPDFFAASGTGTAANFLKK
jgi:hypothetical protein